MNREERYSRQAGLVPEDELAKCCPTVIGVGAIGRQVALQLAAMGVPKLTLVDFDTVEESNIASQGYWEVDLHRLKVSATGEACGEINCDLSVEMVSEKFKRSMAEKDGQVVFCCVDSIETRELIWKWVADYSEFFVDGRMSAEALRVLTACDSATRMYYPMTLFKAEEAYVGDCTAKTTIYCANVAAGLMVAQFTKWLRRMPSDADIQLNLLTSELTVSE